MTDELNRVGWLEKVQTMDDSYKRHVVIWASLVSALLILSVSVKYFDLIVTNTVTQNQASPVAAESFSFGQTMRTGAATIYDHLRDVLKLGLDRIRSPREYPVLPNNNQ